jgi:hypothetical protein
VGTWWFPAGMANILGDDKRQQILALGRCQAVTSNGNSKEQLFVDRFGSRRAVCLSRRRNDADERIGRVQESDLVPGRAPAVANPYHWTCLSDKRRKH